MRYIYTLLLLSYCGLGLIHSQTLDSNYVDGVIYVKVSDTSSVSLDPYDNSNATINAAISAFQITDMERPFSGINVALDNTYRIHFDNISGIDALISTFETISFIEYAEKAPIYYTTYTPNDVEAAQYALDKISAYQAWDISTGSPSVVVAIVDNAVKVGHEDLSANVWVNPGEVAGNGFDDDLNGYTDDVNGYDVADGDGNTDPRPGSGDTSAWVHGTHCAGIAAASTDNNVGISSIGFNVKFMAVKCTPNSNVSGKAISNAYDGVYYAMQNDADVISMSFGGTSGPFLTGESLINSAHNNGIVLVASAGNDNNNTALYPAAYDNVIAVGATNDMDQKASYSNFGSHIDIMAPGSGIFSTYSGTNSSYGYSSGTSMAAPMVAGAAALVKSQNPSYSPSQVKNALLSSADPIDDVNPGYSGQLGAGRLNAFTALGGVSGIESYEEKEVLVWPNPTNDMLSIPNILPYFNYRITVINELGQASIEMQHSSSATGTLQIDVSKLAPGPYFLKLSGDTEVITSSFVVY